MRRVWTCPSCRRAVATPYCPSCGERPRSPRELTLRGLLEQAFEAFTNVDGRLLRSFRCLVAAPGTLTVSFLEGRRKPYLGPVALFLVANVIFFAAESLTHGFVFTTPLDSHLHSQPWSALAARLVSRHIATQQTTLALYAPRFDGSVALHARSLILLMALAFAPLPALMFRRSTRPFAAHVVFSLHLYAFLLLVLSVGTTVPWVGVLFGGERSLSPTVDGILSTVLLPYAPCTSTPQSASCMAGSTTGACCGHWRSRSAPRRSRSATGSCCYWSRCSRQRDLRDTVRAGFHCGNPHARQ
ncbi:MAG TPA: DUF3667 domain-containing protein [Vicinamibacterales bacterium]|nr:DUF3667 domain-containing protein [Vicinamibacterales bacterium]